MISKITLSCVESVEAYISDYLRKWLCVSKNMSHVSLYSDEEPCSLPTHGLVTEFAVIVTTPTVRRSVS